MKIELLQVIQNHHPDAKQARKLRVRWATTRKPVRTVNTVTVQVESSTTVLQLKQRLGIALRARLVTFGDRKLLKQKTHVCIYCFQFQVQQFGVDVLCRNCQRLYRLPVTRDAVLEPMPDTILFSRSALFREFKTVQQLMDSEQPMALPIQKFRDRQTVSELGLSNRSSLHMFFYPDVAVFLRNAEHPPDLDSQWMSLNEYVRFERRQDFSRWNETLIRLEEKLRFQTAFQKLNPLLVRNVQIQHVDYHGAAEQQQQLNLLEHFHLIPVDRQLPMVAMRVGDRVRRKVWRPQAGNFALLDLKVPADRLLLKTRAGSIVTVASDLSVRVSRVKAFPDARKVNRMLRLVHEKVPRMPVDPNRTRFGSLQQTFTVDLPPASSASTSSSSSSSSDTLLHRLKFLVARCPALKFMFEFEPSALQRTVEFFYMPHTEGALTARSDRKFWSVARDHPQSTLAQLLPVLQKVAPDDDDQLKVWLQRNQKQLGQGGRLRPDRIGTHVWLQRFSPRRINVIVSGPKTIDQLDKVRMVCRRLIALAVRYPKEPFWVEACGKLPPQKKRAERKRQVKKSKNPNLDRIQETFPDHFNIALKGSKYPNAPRTYAVGCQGSRQPKMLEALSAEFRNFQAGLITRQPADNDYFFRRCYNIDHKTLIKRAVALGINAVTAKNLAHDELCVHVQRKLFNDKWERKRSNLVKRQLGIKTTEKFENYLRAQERLIALRKKHNPNAETHPKYAFMSGKVFTCPGKKNPYLQMMELEAHPEFDRAGTEDGKRRWCIPCCFATVNSSVFSRTAFCNNEIAFADIDTIRSTGTSNYAVNSRKLLLKPRQRGWLPMPVHRFFNGDRSQDAPTPVDMFLRLGNPDVQSRSSFVAACITAGGLPADQVFQRMRKMLTRKLFSILNGGRSHVDFNGDLKRFRATLRAESDLKIGETQQLLSRPGVLDDRGVNIFVFRVQDQRLFLDCPPHQESGWFYRPGRRNIYLYRNQNRYTAIVFVQKKGRAVGIHAVDQSFVRALHQWYRRTCAERRNPRTQTHLAAFELWDRLQTESHKPIAQVLGAFGRVMYCMTDTKFLVPTRSSNAVPERWHQEFEVKHRRDLGKTLAFLRTLNFPGYQPDRYVVLNKRVRYVVLQNGLSVPVKPRKPGETQQLLRGLRPDPKAILYDHFDQRIKVSSVDLSRAHQSLYLQETYQRLRLEFSMRLTQTDRRLLAPDIRDNREQQIMKFVTKKVRPYIVLISDLTFASRYQPANVRRLCASDPRDPHCQQDKLKVSRTFFEFFKRRLTFELIKVPLLRRQLFDRMVPQVVDPFMFLSGENHVFI